MDIVFKTRRLEKQCNSIHTGTCHELKGELAGVLSLDLRHPYRLLFEPADEPVPVKPDGGLDWAGVTTVRILGVEDTHE